MAVLQPYSVADVLAIVRATPGWSFNAAGVLVQAPGNAARIDSDPAARAWRGVLVEGQTTNFLTHTDSFASGWNVTTYVLQAPSVTGPDGLVSGVKIVPTAGASNGQLRRAYAFVSGTAYTLSGFFKPGECSVARLAVDGGAFSTGIAAQGMFDLVAKSATVTGASASSAAIVEQNDGWFRCSITFTATLSATVTLRQMIDAVGTGDDVKGAYAFGAQMEAGPLSSYIPALGTAATRDADDLALTGIGRWFNAAAGTFVIDFMPGQTSSDASRGILALDDGTGANHITVALRTANNAARLIVNAGGVTAVAGLDTVVASALARHTLRVSYGPAGYMMSLDGAAPVSAAGALPLEINSVRLGRRHAAAPDEYLNGWLGPQFAFYPTQYTDAVAADGFTIRNR